MKLNNVIQTDITIILAEERHIPSPFPLLYNIKKNAVAIYIYSSITIHRNEGGRDANMMGKSCSSLYLSTGTFLKMDWYI